jgi:hypothetical protein
MIEVGLLTIEQKDQLIGQLFSADSTFYPIQDAEDNWVISQQEMEQCNNPKYLWVKTLPLIPYQVKEVIDLL